MKIELTSPCPPLTHCPISFISRRCVNIQSRKHKSARLRMVWMKNFYTAVVSPCSSSSRFRASEVPDLCNLYTSEVCFRRITRSVPSFSMISPSGTGTSILRILAVRLIVILHGRWRVIYQLFDVFCLVNLSEISIDWIWWVLIIIPLSAEIEESVADPCKS